jgi:hypothetical protein
MVPPKGATSNSLEDHAGLSSDDLTAVFTALQEWEEILSTSEFKPEEFGL